MSVEVSKDGQITVTPDSEGVGFFNLMTYLPQLAEEGYLFNILTVDDGACENMTLLGIDKTPGMENFFVKDEDEDRFIVFVRQIISITPISAEEAQSDGEDEDEEDFEEVVE